MTEQEFIERFRTESPVLKAWGILVSNTICSGLLDELGDKFKGFLKMAPQPRVKDLNSALHKAFLVKLNAYKDPYAEMEDKVGVRFVVLLGAEVNIVARKVESPPNGLWTFSKDLDFESRRANDPYIFDKYQSLHYVVKAGAGLAYDELTIPEGTPCEIQIRTLLQHAHSELTHDSFYKPGSTNWQREGKKVERLVARGMALVETTDSVFEDVMAEISRVSEPMERWIDDLSTLYREIVGVNLDKTALSNQLIVDAYTHASPMLSFDEVKDFFRKKQNRGHSDRIREHAALTHLYRLPAILLAYYTAKHYPNLSKQAWPLTERSLEDIFTDVGRSLT